MIQLSIQFDEKTGRIDVTGPITNKVLSLGLLEFAKSQVIAFDPKKAEAEKMIQLAAAGVVAKGATNGGVHGH